MLARANTVFSREFPGISASLCSACTCWRWCSARRRAVSKEKVWTSFRVKRLAVREQADWVSTRRAGDGAVREFAEWWLARRGLLADLLARYRSGSADRLASALPPNVA